MTRRLPSWVRRVARIAFALVGFGFLVWAFLATWDRSQGLPVASWPRLLGALVFGVAALATAARAWATLLHLPVTAELAWGFFLSQLGKYVPGAVWQAVGQVGYATRLVSPQRATGAFAVFTVTQAAAGGAVGSFVVFMLVDHPWYLRSLPLLGLVLLLLLRRSWMLGAVRIYSRVRSSEEVDPENVVPGQAAIIRSTLWSSLGHLLLGLGFVLVVPGPIAATDVLTAIPAFPLAWTIGFLALPFPAGVGIREAALIGLLPRAAATVVAASVAYRLVLMATEVVMIGAARWLWSTDSPATP